MISEPEIVTTEAREAAVIRLTIPRSAMMAQFGPAVGELLATLADQGVEPIGSVFAHHLTMPPDTFDFELGIKVAAPVRPAGRVRPGKLPAARVARTVYTGPYEGLPEAWGAFQRWIREAGHRHAEDLWEVYTVGPHATPDPTGWQTQLNRPLLS